MQPWTERVERFLSDEDGVTMIEYGLIAALVALVCVVAVTQTGVSLRTLWTAISTNLQTAVAAAGP